MDTRQCNTALLADEHTLLEDEHDEPDDEPEPDEDARRESDGDDDAESGSEAGSETHDVDNMRDLDDTDLLHVAGFAML
jgi:hypothetical protein